MKDIFDQIEDELSDAGTQGIADDLCHSSSDAEILQSGLHILNYAFSVEALYEGILSVLTKIVPFSDAAILMPAEGQGFETVVTHAGKLDLQLTVLQGAFARALDGEAVLADDLSKLEGWETASGGMVEAFSSGLIMPLESAEEPAVIICVHVEPAAFNEGHLRGLKAFAPIAAQAVQLAKQRQAMEQHRDHLEELVRDRTLELAEQKEQLAQALEKELELSGLQRQFVSMVCHEFRTPLAIIDGNAQQVSRRPEKITPDRLMEKIGKIRTAVVRLTDLIESVLDAARLEAGSFKLEPKFCRLNKMLEEVCSNYRELNPGNKIFNDVESLQDEVFADIKLMRQVISNLVCNAVKYSPEGTQIWIHGAISDDGNVQISVRDDGVGIPEEEREKLFNRFFRASTSTGIVGTGIGLHLVKTVVDLHGGRIDVDSHLGQGTTLTINFPRSGGEQPVSPSSAIIDSAA